MPHSPMSGQVFPRNSGRDVADASRMAHTSVHLPDFLRDQLDREAKRRGVSRNALITDILHRALKNTGDEWSSWLFIELQESALGDRKR